MKLFFVVLIYFPDGENGYTKKGLVKTETGPMGDANNYTYYQYNSKGNVLVKTVYIDGVANPTVYQYNSKQQIISEVGPDGTRTDYNYNAAGELIVSAKP